MRHKFITLGRIIKAGALNFMRNATLAIAAIAVMVITLTIVLFSLVANATFGNTIRQITDKIDVSVFLKDSVTKEQSDKLVNDLKGIENVKSVVYQSKADVLKEQQKPTDNNLDLQLALAQIDNPFPATIHIKPKDPNKLQNIQSYLEKPDIKALQSNKTSYSGDKKTALDNITRSTKFLRQAGLVGVLIFALVSMLIIFNTIRMAIFNRRDELQIMRLLGANTFYIRGPFVVETIIYGIISAIVSLTLVNALFAVSSSAFAASNFGLLDIQFANDYFRKYFWIILAAQLGLGILIGAVSSIIATRRYLKFKSSK
ncbi:MAG TPA: permease-like cell division protein FtsX [Candidatus Saccharimonadales bacterium]|nr:permease-like cell division protein FtsX [Candidatus Saccharimonadales bacterium]